MKNIDFQASDWKSADGALKALVSVDAIANQLSNVSRNLEEAESDIEKLDADGAIHFSHTSSDKKVIELMTDLAVLQNFTSQVESEIGTTIDTPFYKDLDAFVSGMATLDLAKYTTENRIKATESRNVSYPESGQSQTIEVPKEKVNLEDLLKGNNYYSQQLAEQYKKWKADNPKEAVTKEDFRKATLHTRAFEYTSIEDDQKKKEFWAGIVATVVIIGVGIFCPPAGITLAAGYATLEAGTAVTGKDWLTGRELETEERVLRGSFAALDIIPAVKAFTSGTKTISQAVKLETSLAGSLKAGTQAAKKSVKEALAVAKEATSVRIANLRQLSTQAKNKLKNAQAGVKEGLEKVSSNLNFGSKQAFAIPGVGALDDVGKAEPIVTEAVETGSKRTTQKFTRDGLDDIIGNNKGDVVEKASGASKIDNIDVVDGKIGGKIPVDDFQKIRETSLHNVDTDSMTLGKYTPTIENGVSNWSKAGPDSYIGKAGKDSMYFDLGNDWASIQKQYNLSDTEMFEYLNKPALDDAISSGKEIRFSHNPLDYDNGFIVDEWEYIKKTLNVTDNNLVKNGDFWYVKQ